MSFPSNANTHTPKNVQPCDILLHLHPNTTEHIELLLMTINDKFSTTKN